MMKTTERFTVINRIKRPVTLLLLGILLTAVVQGQEWTRFRGPNGQGISNAQTIPIKWTEQDYNWKVKLPAGGHGSPVIWQDKVFVTCESPEPTGGMLLALSVSDGRVLWREEYKLPRYRFHKDNSYATSTPVVDADRIYVLWQTSAETIIATVSHAGDELWQRKLSGMDSLRFIGIGQRRPGYRLQSERRQGALALRRSLRIYITTQSVRRRRPGLGKQ